VVASGSSSCSCSPWRKGYERGTPVGQAPGDVQLRHMSLKIEELVVVIEDRRIRVGQTCGRLVGDHTAEPRPRTGARRAGCSGMDILNEGGGDAGTSSATPPVWMSDTCRSMSSARRNAWLASNRHRCPRCAGE
jgi:hypothetical protein